ncbi:MAG: TlpA family protein disulfide reductase [Caulobacteraceae bacterium]|nr:TlpA family protein disulfide reductase [Caulobacteraceae bacterium]
MPALRAAPAWRATEWFNTEAPLQLDALRGRVVMICAFQLLCPGCVSHGIPQAQRVAELFRPDDVQVIGLHTCLNITRRWRQALRAFLREYKVAFPVGVDAPEGDGIPQTMRAYGMQGTPTTILIDREGRLRRQAFGRMSDLQLGAEIMALVGGDTEPSHDHRSRRSSGRRRLHARRLPLASARV